ncbi:Trigger factor [Desulfovibrionales bacterium]
MDFNVEKVSVVKRTVHVRVSAEEVNASLGATLAVYRSTAEMPGFRKGKAPSSIIEGRFCKQIRAEAVQDLINLHINEIINQLKVCPVSHIKPNEVAELVKGEPYTYSFSFEIMPEFELPEYVGLDVEQEKAEIDPVEVEAVFDRLREQLADYVDVNEDRLPKDGEAVVVSFKVFADGKLLSGITADRFILVLGKGQALPQFEELVKTLKPTQSTAAPMTFPEDFLNKDLAGKTVIMKLELHSIKIKKLLAVDDDLAKKAGGFKTIDQMREAVERSCLESRKQLYHAGAQKKLLDALLAKVNFVVPESMIERYVDRMLHDLKGRMENRGKHLEAIGKTVEELRQNLRAQAMDLARAEVFLLAVAKREELGVTDRELDGYFRTIAARTGEDYLVIRKLHEENNLMFSVRDRLLADKAMDLIYDRAVVKNVSSVNQEAQEVTRAASKV